MYLFPCNIHILTGVHSQAYLNSEVVVGKVLQGRRRDVIIASKFGGGGKTTFAPVDMEEAITQSLTRMQTDYIDLYQVSLDNTNQ